MGLRAARLYLSIFSNSGEIEKLNLAVRFSPSGVTVPYGDRINPPRARVGGQPISTRRPESSARISGSVRFSNGNEGRLPSRGITAICADVR